MSATIKREDKFWLFRISGVLKKAELDSAQAMAREEINKAGKIKVLLILDGFQGWEKGADWGDMTFAVDHGDDIERIAIVGDPRWETETLMFTGAGFRQTQVKFFAADQAPQARAWLGEGSR